MKKLLHLLCIVCLSMMIGTISWADHEMGHYEGGDDHHHESEYEDGQDYSAEEEDEYGREHVEAGHGDDADEDEHAHADDEMLEYPEECYEELFSSSAAAHGEDSCAREVVAHEIENLNWMMTEVKHLMGIVREVIDLSGKNEFPAGTRLDLTNEANDLLASENDMDEVMADEHDHFAMRVQKFLVERADNVTTGDLAGGESWKTEIVMETSLDDEVYTDAIRNEMITAELNDGTTVQQFDFQGSFGNFTQLIQGKVITDTASGEKLEVKVNAQMQDSFAAMICDADFECEENPNLEIANENKIAFSQTYNGGAAAASVSKAAAASLDNVGRYSFTSNHGSPEGNFSHELVAAWDDDGAGCLNSKESWSHDAFGIEFESMHGNGICGPFQDGTKECEAYLAGREDTITNRVEAERAGGNAHAFAGDCEDGECDPIIAVIDGDAEVVEGYSCFDPSLNDECGGYCPEDDFGDDAFELELDFLNESHIEADEFHTMRLADAWSMGCVEALENNDVDEAMDDMVDVHHSSGARNLTHAWNAAGKNTSEEQCESLLDETFNYTSNVSADEMYEYKEPTGGFCEIGYDEDRKVELLPDGSELCVRDFEADASSSDAPLCSELTPEDFDC